MYDVAALGERFDIVLFIGVLYHLRHPLLALDLIHEHVAKICSCSSPCNAAATRPMQLQPDYEFWKQRVFDRPRLPEAAFHRAQLRARPDELVGAEPRLRGSHAAQRRFRDRGHPEEEVFICRSTARERPEIGAVYPARPKRRTGRSHDRSRDDLERAEQQVPLGFRVSIPDWDVFARMARLAGEAIAAEAPGSRACSAAFRRSTRDFMRLMAAQGVIAHLDAVAVMASRSTGTIG